MYSPSWQGFQLSGASPSITGKTVPFSLTELVIGLSALEQHWLLKVTGMDALIRSHGPRARMGSAFHPASFRMEKVGEGGQVSKHVTPCGAWWALGVFEILP